MTWTEPGLGDEASPGLRRHPLTINKSDIIQDLKQKGFSKPDAAVERILTFISTALWAGEAVSIRNFGRFEPRVKAAVTLKNPKSGIPIIVPERTSVNFKPAPALRDRIND